MTCRLLSKHRSAIGRSLDTSAAGPNSTRRRSRVSSSCKARICSIAASCAGQRASLDSVTSTGPARSCVLQAWGSSQRCAGAGAAAHLLEQLFAEAEARGDKTMMLEVIEQNPRAHALYRRHGFREITRLLSWRREAFPDTHGSPPLEEISIVDAIQIPGAREYPELPWQISRHAVVKGLRPQAFRVGAACVVISDPEAPPIRLQGLWSKTNAWDQLQAAVARVLDHFHESEFLAGAVWPEDFGVHVFEPLGFKQEPISQFLLRRDF